MNHTAAKLGLLGAGALTLCVLPVVLLGGAANPPACLPTTVGAGVGGGGNWLATSYGPPWGGIQGDGITATGLDLTAGQPALEIAVDPSQIPLRSFEHVTPNPFATNHAFYAADTGAAIIARHIDIYDWQGRAAQDAWGQRQVTVTPAATPGTGNLLNEITPTAAAGDPAQDASAGDCTPISGPLPLTNGPTAEILLNGQAAAPKNALRAVQLAIAAGNQIIDKPYLWGGGHGQPLSQIAAAYDCSGSTSYVLHAGGLLGDYARDAVDFETYGQPGAGQWITLYANSAHVFIEVAGIVLDTAWYAPVIPTNPSSGPRWQPASIIAPQYAGDQADGNGGFVQRHPEGL
ncbi:MAG: 3D domain-containing protein [Solirubrobacteraceae bacterium]|jgi:3D (Asp-Asp-Asp) domain-containing protein